MKGFENELRHNQNLNIVSLAIRVSRRDNKNNLNMQVEVNCTAKKILEIKPQQLD